MTIRDYVIHAVFPQDIAWITKVEFAVSRQVRIAPNAQFRQQTQEFYDLREHCRVASRARHRKN